MNNFVHLHVHSDFSLQDAAVSVMQLADRAEELGMTHLALTDHGNMFGIMEFIAACKETVIENASGEKEHRKRESPITPIIGCEVYVSPNSRFEKKGTETENRYYHLVLLAANREGYFNLLKLCSFAYTEGFYYRPRVDEDLLAQYHGGLIALSACVSGEIPRLIRAGKIAEAEQKAIHYRDLFGADGQGNPNFYLELQDHGIPAKTLKGPYSQQDINKKIIAIAGNTGIPLVVTNDIHYLKREDYVAHDILLCIGTAKNRNETIRKKYFGDQFYFKTADEMAALFPHNAEALENTVRIAERCNADIPPITVKELTQYLPDFTIPQGFSSDQEYLRHLASDGIDKRYGQEKAAGGMKWRQIQERCDYELGVITKMGFTGYFLIVMDFIIWAKEHGIPVGPGRGSGAGSIVAYALRITDIDPLKYGLLFERFLNPDRISMPDFDVDFANEGRDEVIKYVTEKYGTDRVGQIITFGTLGAKAVIKDVARTLGISIDESERIAKLIPFRPGITLKKAFEEEPRLQDAEADSRYTELFALARKLEGLNRHSSLHAAGVVIGKSALYNLVPIFKDSKTGAIATQYDMNHLENCGLVKMDFLGLKTLDVIRHTEELIRRRGGKYAHFSVEQAPEDDAATFKMLGEGQSFEVFQFESEGMRNVLKQANPSTIEDLIALNALYRPGPMKNIPQYINSKNGSQAIHYPDPILEDVLRETYGVIVYQEQVMKVAQIIAGYSMGKADLLRRAMGKKKKEILDKEKIPFMEGAIEKGYPKAKAGQIFDVLVPFAEYGFNKTHAAAYSVIAYHTAYLKANFPAEFMAANLTNEIHSANKDKLSECIDEARKMGIVIDPPDINRSDKLFTIVEGRIIYGLLGIKGLGTASADEIVRCRSGGPYLDFMDFLARVDVKLIGKATIEKLIQTGAYDQLNINREKLLGNLERAIEYTQNQKEEKKFGQSSLFGDTGEKEFADFVFEEFPEISRLEKLKIEKQLIGFYFSGHPMDEYRDLWEKTVKVDLGNLSADALKPGSQILVGIVKAVRSVTSKSGKMAYITIADYNGEIDMIFFSRVWEMYQGRLQEDQIAIVRGKIDYQKDKDKYSFIAESIIDSREVEVVITEEQALQRRREKYRNAWLYMADLKSGSLAVAAKGSYTIIGQIISLRDWKDNGGNNMAFGTLRDFEGDIDLVFFSKAWNECRDILSTGEFYGLRGSFDPANDRNPQKPGFIVSGIADIAALSRSAARKADAGETPQVPAASAKPAVVPGAVPAAPPATAPAAPPAMPGAIHVRLGSEAASRDEGIYPLQRYILDNPGPRPVFIHIDGIEKCIRAASGISLEADFTNCAGVTETWKD